MSSAVGEENSLSDDNSVDENPDLSNHLTDTVLKLEEIDVNLFRGSNLWKPFEGRAVFGGQVIGQALQAATLTISNDLHVHSFHAYFIRPGQDDNPILYHVDRIRDGRSFATRMVKSIQRGENILSMLVSFHREENYKLEHQYTMPKVLLPEELMSYDELIMKAVGEMDGMDESNKEYIERYLNQTAEDIPIDVKPVEPHKFSVLRRFSDPISHEANNKLWVRVKGHIDADNHRLHRCAAAYLSDWTLLGTALLPLPVKSFNIKGHNYLSKAATSPVAPVSVNPEAGAIKQMMASLDHSMWFHNHFRADEWMLYECESPRMIGGRALTLGRLWRQDGTLAVSVAQEGIIRATSSKL